MADKSRWRRYEEVATYLLNAIAREMGLDRVEGKQSIPGLTTGTSWEVDAKGVLEDGSGFVVVECRLTSARQDQSDLAALAYQIQDVGAAGGLIVTPLPLQEGARKVADANRIIRVELDPNSTAKDFAVRFLDRLFLGASAAVCVSAIATPTVWRTCVACHRDFELQAAEQICPSCADE